MAQWSNVGMRDGMNSGRPRANFPRNFRWKRKEQLLSQLDKQKKKSNCLSKYVNKDKKKENSRFLER